MSTRRNGPRPAVIGTCCLSRRGVGDPEFLLPNGLAAVDAMAPRPATHGWALDMVVLPELLAHAPNSPRVATAQAMGGRIVTALAEKARAHRTLEAVPLRLREGDRTYGEARLEERRARPWV